MASLLHIVYLMFVSVTWHHSGATTVFRLPAVCDQDLRSQCQGLGSKAVCYDGRIYPNMCDFMHKACTHQVRPNVTEPTSGPSCDISIAVDPQKPASTPAPVDHSFENALFNNAIHGIDDLLLRVNSSNTTLDDQKLVYSVQDHDAKTYVRSNKCWAYPLDLTMISPWNSNHQNRKAGVLVTPRHALWARHYSLPNGTTLRFVDRYNTVYDRTVVRTQAVPHNTTGSTNQGYDIVIGELDHDLPNYISYAKVFPRNLSTIRPLSNMTVPVFGTDFEEKALVANLYIESGNMVNLRIPPSNTLRHKFFESKITGDSGNPVFMVIDNEPVLMFMLTYGGAGSGTSITYHYDDLNNILKGWGSVHRLREKDLSHFLSAGGSVPVVIG